MSRFDRISGRFALVLSALSLLLAMGGTSYAAYSKLARNSVTSATIKNNTVKGIDIRDRSLTAVDFAVGQLPAGAPGPMGPQGVPGPAGPGAVVVPLTSGVPKDLNLANGLGVHWDCDNNRLDQTQGQYVQQTLGYFSITSADAGNVEQTGQLTTTTQVLSQVLNQAWQDFTVSTHAVTYDSNATQVQGFTGTLRNTATGTAVWVDLNLYHGYCAGNLVYVPLTSRP